MKNTYLFSFFSISLIIFFISACTTDSGRSIPEPTFDNVPEPFDISGVEAEPVEDGLTKYVIEEGYGEDQVVIRDNLFLYLTLRNLDGEIIYSSYQDGSTSPDEVPVASVQAQAVRHFGLIRAFSDGLRKGLIGMREGEKRVLIVPPSEGLANIQQGGFTEAFRNDTLRYDLELSAIL